MPIDIFTSSCLLRMYNVRQFLIFKYNTRRGSAPCCRGGGRLEPVQRRLVTLATREGVVFGVETREGGPAKTTLLYVLARTCTGGAEGARCTCNGAR